MSFTKKLRLKVPPKVEKELQKLPKDIQKRFWKCLKLLEENPSHPSLDLQPFHPRESKRGLLWRFKITHKYRAIVLQYIDEEGQLTEEGEVLAVGKHNVMEIFTKRIKKYL